MRQRDFAKYKKLSKKWAKRKKFVSEVNSTVQIIVRLERLEREEFFDEELKEFMIEKLLHSTRYGKITNMAHLMMHQTYTRYIDLVWAVYEKMEQNLKRTVEVFKQAGRTDNPVEYLQNYIRTCESSN